MENVTPQQLGFILLLALIAIAVQTLWAWRAPVIEALRGWLPVRATLGPAAHYVDDEPAVAVAQEEAFAAFERAERPQIVQPVPAPNGDGLSPDDITRIDGAARLLAAGVQGEAAAIELLFDGVKRGGSKRYQTIRDAVRLLAAEKYGWKVAPEPVAPEPRMIPVGRDGHAVEV